MPDGFDVFLSHNSRDKPVVEEIGAQLRGKGLRVWLDKWELRPGFPWQERLEEGVRASRAVAVFVGESGLGSWQEPEMRAFLARSKREEVPVIPVLIPGCPDSPELALFLEALTWVDLREGVTENGLKRLIWGITGVKDEDLEVAVAAAGGKGRRSGPSKRSRAWSWRGVSIGLFLAGLVLALGVWLWPRSPEPPEKPATYAVRVQVLDPQGRPVGGAKVGASVSNEPRGLPDDGWELQIPRAKVPADGRISLWAKHEEWEANQVDLRLGEEENLSVVIRLKEPKTRLRGRVVNNSDQGLPGVRISRQDGVPGDTTTDSEGRFALEVSEPKGARVRLRAEHPGSPVGNGYCYAGTNSCWIVLEER
jgi:hypothetical protein